MTTTYIVLGIARSGTSLCAGLLNIIDVNMDYTLGKPDFYAPKGYYESGDANAINQKIYELAWNSRRNYPNDGNSYYWYPPLWTDVRQQAESIAGHIRAFAARHAVYPKWGFKNPATCLTLELYLPHLDNPRFVVSQRNFEENLTVCTHIYRFDTDYIRSVLTYYQQRLEAVLEAYNFPRIYVHYEDLKNDHTVVAEQLADFCGVEMTSYRKLLVDKFVVKKQFGVDKYCRGSK